MNCDIIYNMKEVKIMYKKFKDCLFAPKKAADYINEPKKHTLIYLLILIFVYIIYYRAEAAVLIGKRIINDYQ